MPKPNCMDIQAVTERLQLLSGETAEQLAQWAPVIASAVRMVELRMFDATDPVVSKRRRCDRLYRRRCNGAAKRPAQGICPDAGGRGAGVQRPAAGRRLCLSQRMTPAAHIIKNQLTRAGNSACLVTGAGRSLPFFCTLQQTWRKNKSNFTDRQTPIGRVDKDFYLYIGPFDRNILELPEDAVLETGDRSYYFIKREAVCMGGQLLYYTGVMKRLQEGSYEVDNGSGDAGTGEAAG